MAFFVIIILHSEGLLFRRSCHPYEGLDHTLSFKRVCDQDLLSVNLGINFKNGIYRELDIKNPEVSLLASLRAW